MDGEYLFEFAGISFRSYSHFYWFLGSMTMFAASALSFAIGLWRGLKQENAVMAQACWSLALLFHAIASVTAARYAWRKVEQGQNPNGPLFSVDCIWFNAMMVGVYVVMFVLFRRLGKRPATEAEALALSR